MKIKLKAKKMKQLSKSSQSLNAAVTPQVAGGTANCASDGITCGSQFCYSREAYTVCSDLLH
ncbi:MULTISPECIES: hypothetical protein [unclassified Pseudoalteromonas]|uniref:hypothetical protein n=1 Tax=unclassified Pseudoalteromonas TaxID=194690 RepID=UPI002096E8B5|nr:hypothetical protein [Pseudoalteromonas sp. XMcav2-N]MCO7187799.1 hypothetical protein [Pseudoalteromonas sp. XMcav2-N]